MTMDENHNKKYYNDERLRSGDATDSTIFPETNTKKYTNIHITHISSYLLVLFIVFL